MKACAAPSGTESGHRGCPNFEVQVKPGCAIVALCIAAGGTVPLDVQALLRERAETTAAFHDPGKSPLAAVARHDVAVGHTLVFGSGDDCDVKLDAAPRASLRALPDGFEINGRKVPPSTTVRIGRYTLRLSHQNFPAVVVLDPESPRLAKGPYPIWFEPDPSARVLATLQPEPPKEEIILSTRGNKRRALRLGKLRFALGGRELFLTAVRLLEPGTRESAVSIFFRDETTGHETYAVGRYVDAEPLGADRYVLDFNRAYNPSCAFSPLYNCPIPPRENMLAVPVRAGERDPGGHE
jgi:hypothetical protein